MVIKSLPKRRVAREEIVHELGRVFGHMHQIGAR